MRAHWNALNGVSSVVRGEKNQSGQKRLLFSSSSIFFFILVAKHRLPSVTQPSGITQRSQAKLKVTKLLWWLCVLTHGILPLIHLFIANWFAARWLFRVCWLSHPQWLRDCRHHCQPSTAGCKDGRSHVGCLPLVCKRSFWLVLKFSGRILKPEDSIFGNANAAFFLFFSFILSWVLSRLFPMVHVTSSTSKFPNCQLWYISISLLV